MRIRRNNNIWYSLLGVFVGVAVFSFLMHGKVTKEAEAASLAGFDPGYIISDWQMGNYNSMSEGEIQSFLTSKNSCSNRDYGYYVALSSNPNYRWHFENGHFICLSEERFGNNDNEIGFQYGETAAHIIWQAAQDYHINPQVLLVLLQKETGLITDPIPNNGDYRKATGYGCPDTAACSSKYYGFRNQIRNAAALFRTVLNGGWTNYPLGNNYIQYNPNAACGGSVVNVRSLATSALYRYTPYQPNAGALAAGYGTASCGAYGNRNFYLYFEDWFGGITTPGFLSAPRNVIVTKSDDGILIRWDKPNEADIFGVEKYEIVIADDNKKEIRAEVPSNAREYLFEDLPIGTYIAASVKAIAKANTAYERVTFNYGIGNPPESPTIQNVFLDDGGIRISWLAPENTGGLKLQKYEIVIADIDRREHKIEVDANNNTVVFYGLPMNEYFAASVKAFNAVGSKFDRTTFELRNYVLLEDYSEYDGFYDLPNDEISKQAVSWAVNNGITDKNQYFDGERALSRRQAMVLLWRLAGQPKVTNYGGFYDLPNDEISKQAVSWAVNNGITDKNQYFDGERALSRRQAMVLLWRLAGQPKVTNYGGFYDLPNDEISKQAVSWAVNNGITDKNQYFDGERALSRRQAMVLLLRFYKRLTSID